MSELLSKQSSALSAQMQAMDAAIKADRRQTIATDELTKAETQAGQGTDATTKREEYYIKSSTMVDQATKSFSSAVSKGKAAALDFAGAMVSNTPGMSKYESSVKLATDGLSDAVSNFGLLGKAAGALLGVMGELIGSSFKYNDNLVQAYDDIAASSTRIGSTPESILKLGAAAGLSSGTLGILTKGVDSLGDNIRGLGLTASQGVDTFGKMIAYGDETLAGYRKLGLTQEDVTNMTAKYVELQVTAGANMRKPIEELRLESKEYMDNLIKQAELQGISAKKQMEAQEQALANENFNAYMNQLEYKISKTTNPEEKKLLENVKKAKMEMAKKTVAIHGQVKATTLLNAISTDGPVFVDGNIGKMIAGGSKILEMAEGANRGESQIANMDRDDVNVNRIFVARFGNNVSAASESSRQYQSDYMIDNGTRANAMRTEYLQSKKEADDQDEESKHIQAQLEAAKKREDGLMAQRAEIESQERELRKKMDPILEKLLEQTVILQKEIMKRLTPTLTFISEHFDKLVDVTGKLVIGFGIMSAVMGVGKLVGTIRNASTLFKGLFNGPIGSDGNKAYITFSGGGARGAFGELSGRATGTETSAAGGKQGGVIGGLVESLKYASANAKDIIKGGAALAGAFITIGGGAAVAIWIVGKALPVFADGMKSFNKVDGKNLALVGLGLLGISSGALAFAGGAVLSILTLLAGKFGVKGPFERVADQLIAFQKLPIDATKVKSNGEAAFAFVKAIAFTIIVGKLSSVAESINVFFDKKPPFKDFKDFSDLTINPENIKNNSLALVEFADATSSYKGTDDTAMRSLNQLIGSQISRLFDPSGPMEAFKKITTYDYGPNADKKANTFFKFASAMGMLTGPKNSSGPVNTLIEVSSKVTGFAAGAIASTVTAIGGLLGKIIKAESGGNANAAAKTSSAYGLGQFTKGTFEGIAKQKGSPVFGVSWDEYKRNPDVQMKALEYLVQQNQAFLAKSGIPVNDASTYLAHFLGPAGARNIYRQPDSAPLNQVVSSSAYNANRSVFDKAETVGGLKIWAANKMGGPPLKAAKGGVFTGPKTGYPMELHGTEIVIPLTQNSVLTKLSQLKHDEKEAGSLYPSLFGEKTSSSNQNTTDRLIEIDGEMKEMMLDKLKRVLTVLDSRHSTSQKLLKSMST
jgi:hypothetical protein